MANTKKKPAKKAIKKKPVAKKRTVTKKVINLMNMTEDIAPKDYLQVISINPDSESMSEAFGISQERFIYLDVEVIRAIKTTDKFSSAVEMVSKHCKHANELAMCVYLLSEERHKVPPIMEFIAQIAKRRGGKGQNPEG